VKQQVKGQTTKWEILLNMSEGIKHQKETPTEGEN